MTIPYQSCIENTVDPQDFPMAPYKHLRRHSCKVEAADLEPFSLVDEVEFSRRFRDIARLAEDDTDDSILLLHRTTVDRWTSQAPSYSPALESPDRNLGFNSRLIGPIQYSFEQVSSSNGSSFPGSQQPSPKRSEGQKSFLDDDWLIDRVEHDSNMALVAAGLVRPRSAVHLDERCRTPINDFVFNPFASLQVSNAASPNRIDSHEGRNKHHPSGSPPRDYICKLCSVSGHWMKDCELFEPRPTTYTSKSASLKNSAAKPAAVSHKSSGHPPGNYVCRLCGVSGHWIEQCSQFQPKAESGKTGKDRLPCFKSIPPPSGYVCNLCQQPGHWLQQCSRFEPINVGGHGGNGRKKGCQNHALHNHH